MSRKAQIDNPILTFAIIFLALIILAPLVLKVWISIQTPFSASLGNLTGGAEAQTSFNHVMNTAINFWDKVIISAFFASVLLLLVSAFFIDTHPAFVILYIFTNFLMILFIPQVMQAADNIYNNSEFVTTTAYLTMTDALRTHYVEILIGLMIVCGVIMYAKINLFATSGQR